MKKLLLLLSLLIPVMASAQTSGTIQKTSATGIVRGSFGPYGIDSLLVTNGPGVNGYVPVYNTTLKKSVFTNPTAFGPTLSVSTVSAGGYANGLNYAAGVFRLGKVSSTNPGVLTTGTDTIAGQKLFTGAISFSSGNPALTASSGDQFFASNNSSSARRRGLFVSDGSTINMQVYTGGSSTLGAFTEGAYLMVYGTGGAGGGGGTEAHLWHSTGKGNMFSMNANTSQNISYFPFFAPTATAGTNTTQVATTAFVTTALVGSLTNPMTTTGDIIYSSNNSGAPARLAIGTGLLTVSSGLPSWSNQIVLSASSANAIQINKTSTGNGILINDTGSSSNAAVEINNSANTTSGGVQAQFSGTSQSGAGFTVTGSATYGGVPFSYVKNGTVLFNVSNTGLVYAAGALSSTMANFRSNNGTAASISFNSVSSGGSDNYGIEHNIVHGSGYQISHNATTRWIRMIAGSNGVELAGAATSWAAISDEKAKVMTDWKPFVNPLEKVSSLRAGTTRYKTDRAGMSRSFLIAQDVQKVLPEAVTVGEDGTLTLRYTEVIPLLVGAVKELKQKVEVLEANIKIK